MTPGFDAHQFLNELGAPGAAFGPGALIGLERPYRRRSAGLGTMALVAVGAAVSALA